MVALVTSTTCSAVAIIGRLKIRHLAARILKLKQLLTLGRYLPRNGRIKAVCKGKASSTTNTHGTTVLVPGSALDGGIAKLSKLMSWSNAEIERIPYHYDVRHLRCPQERNSSVHYGLPKEQLNVFPEQALVGA